MLRYKTKTRPGLVALYYDIRSGNGAGPFLQPRSLHGAQGQGLTSLDTDRQNQNNSKKWQKINNGYNPHLYRKCPPPLTSDSIATASALCESNAGLTDDSNNITNCLLQYSSVKAKCPIETVHYNLQYMDTLTAIINLIFVNNYLAMPCFCYLQFPIIFEPCVLYYILVITA